MATETKPVRIPIPQRGQVGRNTLLDDGWDPELDDDGPGWERTSRVGKCLAAVRAGATLGEAAAYADLNRPTVSRWFHTGKSLMPDDDYEVLTYEKRELQYVTFYRKVAKAEGSLAVETVGVWRQAIQSDWRAAEKFMRRRFPEQWGDREHHVISGPDGGPVRVEASTVHAVLGDPKVAEVLAEMESAVAALSGRGSGEVVDMEPIEDAEVVE